MANLLLVDPESLKKALEKAWLWGLVYPLDFERRERLLKLKQGDYVIDEGIKRSLANIVEEHLGVFLP